MPHTPKAVAKALTDAVIDVGVRVHGRRAERTRDHTQGALRALGITVADLTWSTRASGRRRHDRGVGIEYTNDSHASSGPNAG